MQPEKSDSVLSLMKNTFFSLAQKIDETIFKSAKESLLKSLDELEKTKNGFWLDTIWKKESIGLDFYSERRALIKQLTQNDVVSFVRRLQSQSHFCETLMQPE
jgi:hypothetical protein